MRKISCGLAALCMALTLLIATGIASAAEPQTHKNSIGMEFVLIPAGSFMMGDEQGRDDEKPVHKVTISKPFYMGKYEVTQAEWEAVMGNNPSRFMRRNNPVERVSWDDAQEFIRRLNQKEGHERYRLPTEAEWEYAARAGTNDTWFFGDDENELSGYAWYGEDFDTGGSTHPVGGKRPNSWGLHDVYGNVYEWVQDGYDGTYYANSPGTDPKAPANGSSYVWRGGCWRGSADLCRSGRRYSLSPDFPPVFRNDILGFRLALSPE